jgi:hypothetical protein
MLQQNASRAIVDMQDTTVSFTSDVCKALCWYWWHDPFHTMHSEHTLPGLPDMPVLRKVGPDQRARADFADLDIRCDPFSLQHSTPQSRLQAINSVLQQLQPFMPLLQQQGIGLDAHALLNKYATLLDMPDLPEIFTMQEPVQAAPAQPQMGGMPAETTRNYTRQSLAGESKQAKDASLLSSLQGKSAKHAETNGVMGAL